MTPAPVARRAWLGLGVLGFGASLPTLDFAVNIAFPAITEAFGLETRAIRWVAVAYVLTYASLMLVFGALGDLIGYKRVFRAGLAIGAVAFVLCAVAPAYHWLLAARTLQGVSAALLLSCAPALATSLYDESRRTWVLGVYAGMAVLAGVIAPLIGGVSVALLGWAGVFWFRAPIALLALAMLPWLPGVSTPLAPGALRAFDFAGSLSLAAGLGLLLLAPALLQAGGAAAPAALSAIAGAGLLALFIRRQGAHAGPLLPRALVGEADFILPNLVSTALHVTTFSIPLLVPYYLVRIAGWGPLQSGLLLSAWAIGGLAGSALAERTVRALGARPAAFAGGLLAAAGLAGVSTWPDHARLGWMIAPLLLQGVGIGIFQVAYTDLIVGSLPRSSRGVAGSLTMLTRTVGIVVGASLLTAALHQSESAQLAAGVAAKAAFLGGFQTVLRGAGFGLLAVLALSALRRGLWFGMPRR